MEWIKSHLVVVVVGAVSVLSLVMIGLGLFLSDVTGQLAKDAGLLSNLDRLTPVNASVIEQAKQQQEEIAAKLDAFFARYREIGAREPLYADAFAAGNEANQYAAVQFQRRYRPALTRLRAEVLKADDAPSGQDFTDYADRMERRRESDRKNRMMGLEEGAGLERPGGVSNWQPRRPARYVEGANAEDVDVAAAKAQYAVRRAHEIYCYAGPESLDWRASITDSKNPPSVADMWSAQVALWVQEDVIGALAALNERVAQELPEGVKPWVGNLPVKHLMMFRVGDYVAGTKDASTGYARYGSMRGRAGDQLLPGDAGLVFTGRGSGSNVDVVHFCVLLIIEAQQLLEVMAVISEAGFYTPLNVSYELPPADEEHRYVYGSAPRIKVTLVYEGCFLRSSYDQWMPEVVKTAIASGGAGGMGMDRAAGPGGPPGRQPRRGSASPRSSPRDIRHWEQGAPGGKRVRMDPGA